MDKSKRHRFEQKISNFFFPIKGEGKKKFFVRGLMNTVAWQKLKRDISRTVHPRKTIYCQVGWRNGRKLFVVAGRKSGHSFSSIKKNSHLGLSLSTGDPEVFKRDRAVLRFFRVLRRSIPWWAK